jgi:hypothetical protein
MKWKRINKYDAKRQLSPGSALLLILHWAIEQLHLKYPSYDAETRGRLGEVCASQGRDVNVSASRI